MRIFKTGAGVPPLYSATMLHCYNADESLQSDSLRDLIGTCNLVTANNPAPSSPLGGAAIGKGLRRFVSSRSQRAISAAYTTDVALLGTTATVYASIRLNGTTGNRWLICYAKTIGTTTMVLGVYFEATTNKLVWKYETAAGVAKTLTFTYRFMPGSWYNISLTRLVNGGVSFVTLYVNGGLSETLSDASVNTTTVDTQMWIVGSDRAGANFFDGDICHVSVFSDVHTTAAIQNNLKRMCGLGLERVNHARVHVGTGEGGTDFPQYAGPSAAGDTNLGIVGHCMSTDTLRKSILLFGGLTHDTGNVVSETWEWDGHGWRNISPFICPSSRVGAVMVYDPVRDRHVLFGGENAAGTANAETWEFNPATRTWSQMAPGASPLAASYACGSFDSTNNRVLIYGGNSGATVRTTLSSYDGTTWTTQTTALGPNARTGATCCWVPSLARFYIFGGWDGAAVNNDTRYWSSGGGWVNAAPGAPPGARAYAAGTFWEPEGHLVIMGGNDHVSVYSQQIWHYDPVGNTWANRTPGSGAGYPDVNAKACLQVQAWPRMRLLLYGGENTTTTEPSRAQWEWDGLAWVDTTPAYRMHNVSQIPTGSGKDADFLSDVDHDEDADMHMNKFTVHLMRDMGALSLSKFHNNMLGFVPMVSAFGSAYIGGNYGAFDFLDPMRPIKMDVASVPLGTMPSADQWAFIEDGFISDVEWGGNGNNVTLECFDKGLKLMQCYIKGDPRDSTGYTPAVTPWVVNKPDPSYPRGTMNPPACASWSGTTFMANMEEAMQNVLDDAHLGWELAEAVTLYVPISPVTPFLQQVQRREKVLTALNSSWAEQIGWVCRYIWDDLTDTFRLTLYEPPRQVVNLKMPPSVVLDPRDYAVPREMKTSIKDVINECTVIWEPTGTVNGVTGTETYASKAAFDAAALPQTGTWEEPDATTHRGRGSITVRASDSNVNGGNNSIARFGLISAELIEGSSSAIKTMAQARALALAVVCDLSLPIINASWDTQCMPGLGVVDLMVLRGFPLYMPGGTHTDDISVGVVTSAWSIGRSGSKSNFQFRGQAPAGRRRKWHAKVASLHGDPPVKDGGSLTTNTSASKLAGMVGSFLQKTNVIKGSALPSTANRNWDQPGGPGLPPAGYSAVSSIWNTDLSISTTVTLSGAKSLKIH